MSYSCKLSVLLKNYLSLELKFDPEITGLALDSRLVKPGYLFFACAGLHQDAKTYIPAAIAQGAVAIVTDGDIAQVVSQDNIPLITLPQLNQYIGHIAARFYGDPSQALSVIGITGTNGKTSTSHFIAEGLQKAGKSCGIIGTLGNGMPGHLKAGLFTTPQPIELQAALADCLVAGVSAVAMEVSSHALAQDRVQGVEFTAAVFTNLTRDHLDYHGSMAAYAAAKERLFTEYHPRFKIINRDDAFGVDLCARLSGEIFTYGLDKPPADLKGSHILAEEVQLTGHGISATIKTPWGVGFLQSPLLGRFNLSNLLAALTTLCVLEVPFKEALDILHTQTTVPGRMQVFGGAHTAKIVVDYAHTPDALEKALCALREHCEGVLWCVFGCGGDRDKGKRPLMAQIAEQYSDHIIVTDDNPRHEDPLVIVNDIKAGFKEVEKIIVEHDRAAAIKFAVSHAKPQDIVLVAGKGHEGYQQIGEVRRPFSDIELVKGLVEK